MVKWPGRIIRTKGWPEEGLNILGMDFLLEYKLNTLISWDDMSWKLVGGRDRLERFRFVRKQVEYNDQLEWYELEVSGRERPLREISSSKTTRLIIQDKDPEILLIYISRRDWIYQNFCFDKVNKLEMSNNKLENNTLLLQWYKFYRRQFITRPSTIMFTSFYQWIFTIRHRDGSDWSSGMSKRIEK